jgi:FMN phosphatase YigB (HAD superfamily)
MLSKQNVKCVLTDLDDTLLANARFLQPVFVMRAFWMLRPELGTLSFFRAMKAMTGAKVASSDMLNHERFVQAFEEKVKLNKDECEVIFANQLLRIVKSCKAYFKPIQPGVDFVRKMSQRVPVVLATNPVLTEECTHLRLSWTGLDVSNFAFVTHSQNSHACKPSARYYEGILERLREKGISKEECLFIGNDPVDDAAAIESGITTILIRRDAKEIKMLRNNKQQTAGLYEASWPLIARTFE